MDFYHELYGIGIFGVFALLTIILKYLSVMLNLIFKKQRYLIMDIEKVVKRMKQDVLSINLLFPVLNERLRLEKRGSETF